MSVCICRFREINPMVRRGAAAPPDKDYTFAWSLIHEMGAVAAGSNSRARSNTIQSIYEPYAVFKRLKETSHDVKSDIEYPNAMRPAHNPGYNTSRKR